MTSPIAAKNTIADTKSWLSVSLLVNAAQALAIIVLLFMFVSARKAEKIVQQTPDGDRSRWISESSGPSRQKIIDTGFFMSSLTLDVSPGSVKTKGELLKTWIPASGWDVMNRKIQKASLALERIGGVQSFNPLFATPDPERLRIALTGEFRQWVNGVPIPTETRTYAYIFTQDGSRLYLADWFESSKDKPFEKLKTENDETAGK